MKFDLISDLHLEFWEEHQQVNWEGIGTSLLAVVAGDISYDIERAYKTIVDISKHYRYVIYVDGNHEHNNSTGIKERNQLLKEKLSKYQNICFLNRNAIIVDGVAFVGANGWWTFDFCEPNIFKEDAYWYFASTGEYSEPFMQEVLDAARLDATVLSEIVGKLNSEESVDEIVMVTHTSPNPKFVSKTSQQDIIQYSRCGSSYLKNILNFDYNNKISTWCFGHVHQDFDEIQNGIRYICHPRGRSDDCPQNKIYYPKLIDLSVTSANRL